NPGNRGSAQIPAQEVQAELVSTNNSWLGVTPYPALTRSHACPYAKRSGRGLRCSHEERPFSHIAAQLRRREPDLHLLLELPSRLGRTPLPSRGALCDSQYVRSR